MDNSKYLIAKQREVSEAKKIIAIDTIRKMLRDNEKITIVELTKETGLSRSFFYKNEAVKKELDEALATQQGKVLQGKRDLTLNAALKSTIKMQKAEINKLRMETERLRFLLKEAEKKAAEERDYSIIDKM